MPGINRATIASATLSKSAGSPRPNKTCVFISHKREDSVLAQEVGDLLTEMEIDIWLDLRELKAGAPSKPSEHAALAQSIETGLANSTHLLALITPKTQGSWWVPYEIGSARAGGRELAFLLHKDVPTMPSYFVFGEWLVDQEAVCSWAEKISSIIHVAKISRIIRLTNKTTLDAYLPKHRRL